MQPEPRFASVEDALRFAFAIEGVAGSANFEIGASIKGTNPGELTFHERIAEGSLLRQRAFAVAGEVGAMTLRAWYGRERDSTLSVLKRHAVGVLGDRLARDFRRHEELMEDAVRDWCHMLPMVRSYRQWAELLGVDKRQVYRWCTSKDPTDRSARWVLDSWRQVAEERVEVKFAEHGLVPG